MKKFHFLKALLIVVLITSCSSSDENSTPIDEPQPITEKLIKKVTNTQYNHEDTFYFENDKPIKYYSVSCSGTLSQFEYGNNDKIYKVYSKNYQFIGTPNIEATSINQPENLLYEYEYDGNNRIIKVIRPDGTTRNTVSYDANGRINKITRYYTSASGGTQDVKEIIFSDYDANGNATKIINDGNNFTVEYDDKVNPAYILFKNFGIFDFEFCNSLEEISHEFRGYVSPNNPISVKNSQNVVVYSAVFTYDTDNYPTRNEYYLNNGNTINGTDLLEY